MKERSQDSATPDASVSQALKNTKQITETVDRYLFCKSCRRLFQDTGTPTMTMSKTDILGTFYSHWNGHYLTPLCLLLETSHRKAKSIPAENEEMPACYGSDRSVNWQHFCYVLLLLYNGAACKRWDTTNGCDWWTRSEDGICGLDEYGAAEKGTRNLWGSMTWCPRDGQVRGCNSCRMNSPTMRSASSKPLVRSLAR